MTILNCKMIVMNTRQSKTEKSYNTRGGQNTGIMQYVQEKKNIRSPSDHAEEVLNAGREPCRSLLGIIEQLTVA